MANYQINSLGKAMFRYTGQLRIDRHGLMGGEVCGFDPKEADALLAQQSSRGIVALEPLSKEEVAVWEKKRKQRNAELLKNRQALAEKKAAKQGIPVSGGADVSGLQDQVVSLRKELASLKASLEGAQASKPAPAQ